MTINMDRAERELFWTRQHADQARRAVRSAVIDMADMPFDTRVEADIRKTIAELEYTVKGLSLALDDIRAGRAVEHEDEAA